jgi:hypothetical protein
MVREFRLDRRKRGRPKGSKTWGTSMLAKLGRAVDRYEALYPKATLDEIAEAVKSEFPSVLVEAPSLRKRFPEARKAQQEAQRFSDYLDLWERTAKAPTRRPQRQKKSTEFF